MTTTLEKGNTLITESEEPTYLATIYVGLKERATGTVIDKATALECIQRYVNAVGLCVSVSETTFVYVNGQEPGIRVGLINYPRFPDTQIAIERKALVLAEGLLKTCKQLKVSVVFPSRTVMLGVGSVASTKPEQTDAGLANR